MMVWGYPFNLGSANGSWVYHIGHRSLKVTTKNKPESSGVPFQFGGLHMGLSHSSSLFNKDNHQKKQARIKWGALAIWGSAKNGILGFNNRFRMLRSVKARGTKTITLRNHRNVLSFHFSYIKHNNNASIGLHRIITCV